MAPSDAAGGSDRFDADLRALTDQQRATDAADARRREHSLRAQAADEGSFAGVLLDLGEREQLLAVATVTGRVLRGVIRTVGADFVSLGATGGETALVALTAIGSVRAEPGSPATVGDRVVPLATTLAGLLAELAPDRPWVSVHVAGGDGAVGELLRGGRDLVVVRGDGGTTTYVPLANVTDIVLP